MSSPLSTLSGSLSQPPHDEDDSNEKKEKPSICFSVESNQSEGKETPLPLQNQQRKKHRNTRRRTLAPLFDNRINCSSIQKDVDDFDSSNCVQLDFPLSLGKRCWESSEDNVVDEKNEKSVSSTNTLLFSQGLESNQQLDEQSQYSELMATPPSKQKRIKTSQRRRSLAIQDDRLLLQGVSGSSSSSITYSPFTFSSISTKGSNQDENRLVLSSFSDDEHHGNVTIKSEDPSSSLRIVPKLPAPVPIRRSARIRKSMAIKKRASMLNNANDTDNETCSQKIEIVRFRLSTLSPIKKSKSNVTGPLVKKYSSSVSTGISKESSKINNETEIYGLNELQENDSACETTRSNQTTETFGSVLFKLSTLSPISNKSKTLEGQIQTLDPVQDNNNKSTLRRDTFEKERNVCSKDACVTETSRVSELKAQEPDQTITEDKSLTLKLSTLSLVGMNSCKDVTSSSSVCHEEMQKSLDSLEKNINIHVKKDGHFMDKGKTATDNVFAKKTKQRRRSSLGLHVGGLISLKDLEAIQNEVAARKKPSQVLTVQESVNKQKCDVDFPSVAQSQAPPRSEKQISLKYKLDSTSNVNHEMPSRTLTSKEGNTSHGSDSLSPHFRHPNFVTAQHIKEEMLRIFRGLDLDKTRCVSSRLFACAIVSLKRGGQDPESLQLLYPLLRSFVEAELAALEDFTVANVATRKKIHFCSYDFSSTITPVDTSTESINIIEGCIWKLQRVLKEAERISVGGCRSTNLSVIKELIKMFDELGKENGYLILVECSKTMPVHWQPSRFKRALQQYREEFAYILSEMETSDAEPAVSFARKTLGDFIGRIIRYHLRRLFNPVPLPLYSDGDDLPDYSHTRSRVHTLVEMIDEGGRDTATADGSISSVIGTALNRIIDFFEMNKELLEREGRQCDNGYSDSFCKRPATIAGLVGNGCVIELSEDDISEVLLDIRECHTILAGVRACLFIKGLLTWPGVPEAIQEVGGWREIETFSKMFLQHRLDKEMPEEGHFILLADVNSLLNKFRTEKQEFLTIEQKCEDSLRRLWKRFRCGTRNKELLELNPCIKIFQQELMKVGHKTKLPLLARVTLT